mmetsp:Transcript_13974/g.32912  ORF Transcript_13974/g.32912 Transcript_13974/m.32912 type:complete len:354 (+) Transcript_13974:75-1136(+)
MSTESGATKPEGGSCEKPLGDGEQEKAKQGAEKTKAVSAPADRHRDGAFLYVIGGRDRGKTLGLVERFSFKDQLWETCPHMLIQRGSHGAATLSNRVFALAGGGIHSNLSSSEVFDHRAWEWKETASMTTERHALSVAATDKHIYAIGGWMNGSVCTSSVERYDAVSNAWTECAGLLQPRRLHGVAAVGENIYVFGGATDTQYEIKHVERYDAAKNIWEVRAELPVGSYASASSVGKCVYVFLWGKHVVRYDTEADTYETMVPLPLPEWFGFATASLGDSIFVVGGATRGRWSRAAFRFDPAADGGKGSWEALPEMFGTRRRCAATCCFIEPNSEGGAPRQEAAPKASDATSA